MRQAWIDFAAEMSATLRSLARIAAHPATGITAAPVAAIVSATLYGGGLPTMLAAGAGVIALQAAARRVAR